LRIAILGVGAVGLGLATALARPGERLLLVGRDPETARAITREGIRRSGLFGTAHVPPAELRIELDPGVLVEAAPDWLLVCTKAHSTGSVARALAPLAPRLADHTRLVLCQNGWGNEAPFLPFWPRERLLHARVITGFHRRSPTDVEITAHAQPIALGSLLGPAPNDLPALAARIDAGGIPAETHEDMRAVLWAKMLYNCSLNPLGALARRRYGELTADPATRVLVETVIREIFAVLSAAGVEVAWPDADAYLESFHAELIPPTARHESSMLQDLRAGRPTEIEALCGAVERLGAEAGVSTPTVSALATLVRAAEARSVRSGEET
jgi:2-dehydropantoate 2-reductase